ncbi:MAG: TonB-dependent receptor [Deltaproteobacteria bacterium]|jgi:vitamin B12 transporter|nr:TonB-dependent receptor [Deltaproteobacteria bacterium]
MRGRFFAAAAAAALTAATLAVPAPVAAQSQRDLSTEGFLDMLVVTASRTLERIRDVPQNMEVITEDEIRASGASDLTDIMEEHGIQVNFQNSRNYGNDVITMRGFSTSTHGNDILSGVQVLLNGRRVGLDSLSIMGIDAVDHIEIIHGPGSVMYGSAGMGGVINIITKRGAETPAMRAELGFSEFDTAKSVISGSGRSGNLDIAASLGFTKAGDYKTGNGDALTNTGLGGRYGYYLNLGYNLDERNRLGVMFQGSVSDKGGSPSENYATSTTTPPIYRGKRYDESQDKTLHSGDLIYEGQSERGDLDWLVRYYYGKSSYKIWRVSFLDAGVTDRFNSSENRMTFQGAQAQLGWDYGILHLTAGIDWYGNDMTQRQIQTPYTTNVNSSFAKSKISDIGAFLLAKLSLLERRNLVFTGAVRYDKFTIDIHSISDRRPAWADDSRSYTKTIPSFGVAYSPTDFLKLRGNIAKAYRVPSPRQLIGNFFMGSTIYYGDPNLVPEESTTWDFGFDVDYNEFLFSATYFATDFTNYIGTTRDHPYGAGTMYLNIAAVTINGVEAKLRYNMGRALGADFDLTPWAGWTRLLKYVNKDGDKLAGLSEDVFSAGLDFRSAPAGLTARVKAVYYGKPKVNTFSSQAPPSEKGGATVFDFALTKRIAGFDGAGEMSLTVEVDNLFDKSYTDTGSVEMPGREIYVGLVYTY